MLNRLTHAGDAVRQKSSRMLGRSTMVRESEEGAVLALLRDKCQVPPEELNRAIRSASTASSPDTCLELLRQADSSAFDESSGCIAVQFFGRAGDWQAALTAFEQLGERKQHANAQAVLQMLRALLGQCRAKEALAAYEQILGQPLLKGRLLPTLPVGLQDAIKLRDERLRLQHAHHDVAMAACLACGEWERAHMLLSESATRRQSLAPASYEAGICLFELAGEWQLCLWALQGSLRAQVTPTPPACVATLGALGAAGEWERVLNLLDDFLDWDVKTNAAVVNATITALLRNGRRGARRTGAHGPRARAALLLTRPAEPPVAAQMTPSTCTGECPPRRSRRAAPAPSRTTPSRTRSATGRTPSAPR